jgi:peptidyl-prolyl cis-trans isomerase B (cyclophilin B)
MPQAHAMVSLVMLFSALIPQKGWFAPDQPVNITVKAQGPVTLFMTNFAGRSVEAKSSAAVDGEKTVDVKTLFTDIATPGTYLLYAVPKDKPNKEFVGTPLVIGVREDKRQGAPPGAMCVKVEPLCFAIMTTEKGPMSMAFYYDVAPNTVSSFLSLSATGYYEGLTFHRVLKDFMIQGGDPRGDGSGGPGYTVEAEFNERKHVPGVLSMARSGDPNEAGGAMPRCEYANSAGSQFFVCLNAEACKQLDRRYTAFGKLVSGIETATAIVNVPLADEAAGRPVNPPKILKVDVKPVTAAENPYPKMMDEINPSTIKQ